MSLQEVSELKSQMYKMSPPESPDEAIGSPATDKFQERVSSARRMMVLGALLFGWVFEPWAFFKSRSLICEYRESGFDDPLIYRRLLLVRAVSGFLSVVFWLGAIAQIGIWLDLL